MAAIIASLIGLIALSVSTTAVACGVARYSSDGRRSRRPKAPSAHKKRPSSDDEGLLLFSP
ncbi:hypothetical protein D0B32_11820 [Paraburkholderia sp. DHOC27]|nr:hypothetical protein D0B32_11820 [Paraburkholderia sp. DHOC27]